jgi:hypothetical protein
VKTCGGSKAKECFPSFPSDARRMEWAIVSGCTDAIFPEHRSRIREQKESGLCSWLFLAWARRPGLPTKSYAALERSLLASEVIAQ